MGTVRPHPPLHGVEEILVTIVADPGFFVRSNIGGIQRSEGQK